MSNRSLRQPRSQNSRTICISNPCTSGGAIETPGSDPALVLRPPARGSIREPATDGEVLIAWSTAVAFEDSGEDDGVGGVSALLLELGDLVAGLSAVVEGKGWSSSRTSWGGRPCCFSVPLRLIGAGVKLKEGPMIGLREYV